MYTINAHTGVVTRDSDGVVCAPAQSVTDPLFVEYIDWVHAGNTPNTYYPPEEAPVVYITKFAFRNRLTSSEKVVLEMATLDDPSQPMQARQLAATLRVYLRDLEQAEYVDLSSQEMITGMQQLVALGLLSQERATAILTDPIQPKEVYGI